MTRYKQMENSSLCRSLVLLCIFSILQVVEITSATKSATTNPATNETTTPAANETTTTTINETTTTATNETTTPAPNKTSTPAINETTTPAANETTTPAPNETTTTATNETTTPPANETTTLTANEKTAPKAIETTTLASNETITTATNETTTLPANETTTIATNETTTTATNETTTLPANGTTTIATNETTTTASNETTTLAPNKTTTPATNGTNTTATNENSTTATNETTTITTNETTTIATNIATTPAINGTNTTATNENSTTATNETTTITTNETTTIATNIATTPPINGTNTTTTNETTTTATNETTTISTNETTTIATNIATTPPINGTNTTTTNETTTTSTNETTTISTNETTTIATNIATTPPFKGTNTTTTNENSTPATNETTTITTNETTTIATNIATTPPINGTNTTTANETITPAANETTTVAANETTTQTANGITTTAYNDTTTPSTNETTTTAANETITTAANETTTPPANETTSIATNETTTLTANERTAPKAIETTTLASNETITTATNETTTLPANETTTIATNETTTTAANETTTLTANEKTAPKAIETTTLAAKKTTPSNDTTTAVADDTTTPVAEDSITTAVIENTSTSSPLQPAFYSWGVDQGDSSFYPGQFQTMYVENGFLFGRHFYQTLYIYRTGYISFGSPYNGVPTSNFKFQNNQGINLLAVYWQNLVYEKGSAIYYQIYDKDDSFLSASKVNVIERATNTGVTYFGDEQFEAIWVLVITWYELGMSGTSGRATFQSVLVTDYTRSFVEIEYLHGSMNIEKKGGLKILMGMTSESLSQKFPDSGKVKAFTIDEEQGNVFDPNGNSARRNYLGYYIYSLSIPGFVPQNSIRSCNVWHQSQRKEMNRITWNSWLMPSCPGNYFFTWFDRRWRYLNGVWGSHFCVYLRSNWWTWPATKTCCYHWDFWYLIRWAPLAGTYKSNHPLWDYTNYYNNDVKPYEDCCQKSNLCHKYFDVRPIGPAYLLSPIFFAISFGDPHIETLDGRGYTFNGLGEYVMMDLQASGNDSIAFMLQARTERALNKDGNVTDATIFTAFAGEETVSNASFQIELAPSKESLVVTANSFDISAAFNADADYEYEDQTIGVQHVNDSAVVSFVTGVSVTVTLGIKMLTVSVALPDTYLGKPKGLLGNFDKNKKNDFILPDGTPLSDTLNDRQIFHDFGEKWKVGVDTTIFTYTDGKSSSDYIEEGFAPIFLDEVDAATKQDAEALCGENVPCIFDFIQTKDESIAESAKTVEETAASNRETLHNESPAINGSTEVIHATVGQEVTFTYIISDTEDDTATVDVLSKPDELVVNAETFTVSWTPATANETSISITAKDTKNATAAALDIKIIMCNLCSEHGTCDFNNTREASADRPLFSLARCDCNRGYEGADCEADINGCKDNPCSLNRACTDVLADQQTDDNGLYTCAPCPSGYNTKEEDCIDKNECTDGSSQCSDIGTCVNTEGSYECTCPPGYRLSASKQCIDINECSEGTHDCVQLCDNTSPGFNCTCYSGYTLNADGMSCDQGTQSDLCNNAGCANGCVESEGAPTCFCFSGYQLESDGKACQDIDECNPNICSQECENFAGTYTCSCYKGYQQSEDKVSCTECDDNHWGEKCANTCDCNHGDCDAVRGCLCDDGWEGTHCEDDINECNDPTTCGTNQNCTNIDGSYLCSCIAGFQMSASQTCEDIVECDDPNLNQCPLQAVCENNVGSYSCKCKPGYRTTGDYTCEDIDECETSHGCEHTCNNQVGTFKCSCFFGFELEDNRKNCRKVSDPCAKYGDLECSYACRLKEVNNETTVECYCASGFYLGTDHETCLDIDECESDETNKCSDKNSCVNTDGGYTCSCSRGSRMENDGLTCTPCDDQHFGENCAELCECSPEGASMCDPVSGCECKTGWTGPKCYDDLDECDTTTCQQNSECKNIPGSHVCECLSGYSLNNAEECEDINECDTGEAVCDQVCINNNGSYTCSCNTGFQWSAEQRRCEDIDECKTGKHDCSQECLNSIGGYICDCFGGYTLNTTDRRTCTVVAGEGCNRTDCSHACRVENGVDVCFCNKGYKVKNGDDAACEDKDECVGEVLCSGDCVNTDGSYTCNCSVGFELMDDEVTCQECSNWKYDDCQTDCSCVKANTEDCSKVNGECTCKSGWKGATCNEDIDECTEGNYVCPGNSTCQNTNGGYNCKCENGFVKTSGQCTGCVYPNYGENCALQCPCNSTNTAMCNPVTGDCTCNEGWMGTSCDTDVKECDANPNPCADILYSSCTETPGTYRCDCDAGYKKSENGSCIDIDECLAGLDDCSQICTNTDGNFICSCNAGFKTNGSDCSACLDMEYGIDCKECSCIRENTESCNKVNGSCTCKTGWEGDTCVTDIDECTTQTVECPTNAHCQNYDGGFLCQCDSTFYREDTQDSFECKKQFDEVNEKKYKVKIKLNIVVKAWTVPNENDENWRSAKTESVNALTVYYRDEAQIPGFIRVIVLALFRGSLSVEHNVITNDTGTSDTDTSTAIEQALTGDRTIIYNGTAAPVESIEVEDSSGNLVEITADDVEDKCTVFTAISPCPANQMCYLANLEPKCRAVRDTDLGMVIGLGVGIPLFLLVCLVITLIFIYYKHVRRGRGIKKQLQVNLDQSVGRQFLPNVIRTKLNSKSRRTPFYGPGGWESESESSREMDAGSRRGLPPFQDGFSNPDVEPYYYDNGAVSNFSWDFVYQFLDPGETFKIQRPSTDIQPHPDRRNPAT